MEGDFQAADQVGEPEEIELAKYCVEPEDLFVPEVSVILIEVLSWQIRLMYPVLRAYRWFCSANATGMVTRTQVKYHLPKAADLSTRTIAARVCTRRGMNSQ